MSVEVGKKAPDFKLLSDEGREVSLKEFAGKKVVLYFYPKDQTPGCTTEACDFRDLQQRFGREGVVVLGVSKDSVASHQKFKAAHGLNFPLLSDPETKVLAAYGAWGEKVLYGKKTVGTVRTTVLIDERGRVQRVWPKVKVAGHAQEVLEAAKADAD